MKLPFVLQNAKEMKVPEDQRAREWLLEIKNIEVKPPLFEDELEAENSVCDVFRLFIKEMSLTYFKNGVRLAHPVVVPRGFDLLLKVKNGLKYLLAQQDSKSFRQ